MQMVLLGLMMFTLVSFFTVVAYLLIPLFTGTSITDISKLSETSPRNIKDAFLFFQGLSSVGIFLAPAALFAYMMHPRPVAYLGLRKPGSAIHWILVPVVMLGAIPVLLGIESIFREINLGGKMQDLQNQNDNALKALLTMNSFSDFLKAFIVMSIFPGICEELLFRGVLMRMAFVRTQKIGVAIALSSFVFAVVHYNPVGLFAIFFAAVLLGLIYYLTGSLWMSMLAHFLNNGLQIMLMYMGTKNAAIKTFVEGNSIPLYFPLAGAAVFAGAFYLLWKYRTPLPDDWADDFAGETRETENDEERRDVKDSDIDN